MVLTLLGTVGWSVFSITVKNENRVALRSHIHTVMSRDRLAAARVNITDSNFALTCLEPVGSASATSGYL